MQRLTLDQRLQIVEFYFQNQCSARNVYRALRPFYGPSNRPSEATINKTIHKFRSTYTLWDSIPKSAECRKNIGDAEASVGEYLDRSTHHKSETTHTPEAATEGGNVGIVKQEYESLDEVIIKMEDCDYLEENSTTALEKNYIPEQAEFNLSNEAEEVHPDINEDAKISNPNLKGHLNEHIKFHKRNKLYNCEICGHAFAQTQQLSRHMNTHTGNRPYKCSYCTAAFADLSTRNKHHRIHTNERPYVCDVCGKAYSYTNSLKIHKMVHTGEKPHVCEICGKGFLQAYKLRNHKFTHEKKNLHESKSLVKSLDTDDESSNAAIHLLEM